MSCGEKKIGIKNSDFLSALVQSKALKGRDILTMSIAHITLNGG
jgi:hypothetical protein